MSPSARVQVQSQGESLAPSSYSYRPLLLVAVVLRVLGLCARFGRLAGHRNLVFLVVPAADVDQAAAVATEWKPVVPYVTGFLQVGQGTVRGIPNPLYKSGGEGLRTRWRAGLRIAFGRFGSRLVGQAEGR